MKSSWSKSAIVMAALVAALTVVALILVVVGVVTHQEPGLMEGAPRWQAESFPLQVCSRPYAGDDPVSVYTPLVVMNTRLGFDAFAQAVEDCDILVTVGVPSEPGWMDPGGDALLTSGTGGVSCDVRTSNVMGEVFSLVVQHELGHCLGLEHDDFESSIMRRAQSPTPMGAMPPWISDDDRELLRSLYAPH